MSWLGGVPCVVACLLAGCGGRSVATMTTERDPNEDSDVSVDPAYGCPTGTRGSPMVVVPAPDGSTYCIDAREVTSIEYQEFAANAALPDPSDPFCGWKGGYRTPNYWPPPPEEDHHAIGNTAACDAIGYCAWAGKRLCGRIGGGALTTDEAGDAARSEWYNACSKGGTRRFPYGDEYDGFACVTNDFDGDPTVGTPGPHQPVGSVPTCEGGYPGIFDMSGGVREFENACRGEGYSGGCLTRGGHSGNQEVNVSCDAVRSASSSFGQPVDGIRCCADSVRTR